MTIVSVSMVHLTRSLKAPVGQQHHSFLFKPRPRKCYGGADLDYAASCRALKSSLCPSLSFLRNTDCYRGTYTHVDEVLDKTGSDFVATAKKIKLNLKSFFGRNGQPAFSNNKNSKLKPTLLTHRFEALPYNKELEEHIDKFNEELGFIVNSKQHPDPFKVEGHVRSHLPKMPDNTFDILNICSESNEDKMLYPRLTKILFEIVHVIEKSTLHTFLRNFRNSTASNDKSPSPVGISKAAYSPLVSSASVNLSCVELFASHTSIEEVELHCDTSNMNQNNLQIIAWVPLHDVFSNPLIIKDNGGTKTSLCDDIVSVENGNEYYYTSSGMKKGEMLVYLNPAATATINGDTPLLNESPIHGSVKLTPHDLKNDLKNHRILINMNLSNARIENGW